MIVRCTTNSFAELPESYIDPAANMGRDATSRALVAGQEYVVYAISVADGRVEYYVHEDDEIPYPYAEPAPMFEVVDATPSSYWRVGFDAKRNRLTFAFDEWFSMPNFYDRLTDWEEHEGEVWKAVKARLDAEALGDAPTDDQTE